MTEFRRNLSRLILGALVLSTSAPWVEVADVAPTAAGFYRMAIGTLLLVAWCAATGRRVWGGWRHTLELGAVAAFFAADLFMWHRSIHWVGPGFATILANFQVFVLAAAGALLYGESLDWKFGAGLALALPGVALLVGIDLSALPPNYLTGVALGLGAAVAYSGYLLGLRAAGVHAKDADEKDDGETLTAAAHLTHATFWCGGILAGVVAVEGASFAVPDLQSGLALLAYGGLIQVVAWLLISDAMPRLPASLVGLFLLLQPALAMVWDVVFFARPTGWLDAAGAALVLAGLYLASLEQRSDDADPG